MNSAPQPRKSASFTKVLYISTLIWMVISAISVFQIFVVDRDKYFQFIPEAFIWIIMLITFLGTLVLGLTYPIVWLVQRKRNTWYSFVLGALPSGALLSAGIAVFYFALINPLLEARHRREIKEISTFIKKKDLSGFLAAQQACGQRCTKDNQLFVRFTAQAARYGATDIFDTQLSEWSKRLCTQPSDGFYGNYVQDAINTEAPYQNPCLQSPGQADTGFNDQEPLPAIIFLQTVRAPSSDSLRVLLRHLDAKGIDVALGYAARANRVDLMEILLKSGADLRTRYRGNYQDLMTIAARYGAKDVIHWLVQKGINAETMKLSSSQDTSADPPLLAYATYLTGYSSNDDQVLLEETSVTVAPAAEQNSPCATEDPDDLQSEDIVGTLVNAGYSVNQSNRARQTPLSIAVLQSSKQNPHLLLALIKNGARYRLVPSGAKDIAIASSEVPLPLFQGDQAKIFEQAYQSAKEHMTQCHESGQGHINSTPEKAVATPAP